MIHVEYTWPFDPTGKSAANKITGERHVLSVDSGNGFHYFIPKAAPYFLNEGFKLTHVETGRVLKEGIDFDPGFEFEIATQRSYIPVFGAVSILDKNLNGTFEIEYQTIGGEYVLDTAALTTILSNTLTDPRVTTWESVQDKPIYFKPLKHVFNIDRLVGEDNLVEALGQIANAILQSADAVYPALNAHIQNQENPHGTTKQHVGLGLVPNYAMATLEEALAGVALNKFLSPGLAAQMMASFGGESVAGHVANKNNPHNVTKLQVGLGNVANYVFATLTEAKAGRADRYLSPDVALQLIDDVAGSGMSAHVDDRNNPHGTTKTHVGLGNVSNFPVAGNTELDAGTSSTHYVVVSGVKRMLDNFKTAVFDPHVNNKTNPHAVTATQVGLGQVQNYPVAGDAVLDAGTSSAHYVVVSGVTRMINAAMQLATDHFGNKQNPHEVTATQVGLGNVQNYGTGSIADYTEGTSNSLYATIAGVAQMINEKVGTKLANHIADKNNPHETTAEHVGLEKVKNYGTATVTEAIAGIADDLYTTPKGVLALINAKVPGATPGEASKTFTIPATTDTTAKYYRLATLVAGEFQNALVTVLGATANGRPQSLLQASMYYSEFNPVVLNEYDGNQVIDEFGYVVIDELLTVELWMKTSRIRSTVEITKHTIAGEVDEADLATPLTSAPADYVVLKPTYVVDEAMAEVQIEQSYDTAKDLSEAIDTIDGVTPAPIESRIVGTDAVKTTAGANTVLTWTGSYSLPASGNVRLVVDKGLTYGGTVRVVVGVTDILNVSITEPTKLFETPVVPSNLRGTQAVKLIVTFPTAGLQANIAETVVRSENLVSS